MTRRPFRPTGGSSLRRIVNLVLALALLACVVPPASAQGRVASAARVPILPLSENDVVTSRPTDARTSGDNRIETALEISRKGSGPFSAVVIATSQNFPDALAGAPLAKAVGGPILLTGGTALNASVRARLLELKADGVTTAYLLGGTGTLSPAVHSAVRDIFGEAGTVRIGGPNRYATAAMIATRLNAIQPVSGVVLASGEKYPDALSAAGWAAFSGGAVLLTRRDSMPTSTSASLDAFGYVGASSAETPTAEGDLLVVGGATTVSDAVAGRYKGAVRIAGADRYDTSARIAEYAWEHGMPSNSVALATGRNFPDALAAGPWGAANGAPLLLVTPSALPSSTEQFLKGHASTVKRIEVFGGVGSVAPEVVTAAADAAVTMTSKKAPVASAETNELLSEITTDTLTFSSENGQLAGLDVGWVIRSNPTSAAPDGYFRKILAVNHGLDGSVSYETTTAQITDVLLKGSYDTVMPVGEDATGTLAPTGRKARVRPAAVDGSASFGKTVTLPIGQTAVIEKGDQKVTFSANGNLDFRVSLVISIVIDGRWKTGPFGVQYWEAYVDRYDQFVTYTGTFSLSASITGKADVDVDLGPAIPVAADPLITGFLVAPEVQMKLRASIGVEFTASYAITVFETKAGVRYRDGKGWSSFEEKPSTLPNPRFHPDAKISGSVKIGIGAKIAVKFGKVAGPYLDVTLLFGRATVQYDLLAHVFSADVQAGLAVSGGLEAEVPMMGIELGEFELFEREIVLFSRHMDWPVFTPLPASKPPWPMFGRDAQHTHRSPVNGPETNHVAWFLKVGDIIHTGPAVAADGTIYVNSWDGVLSATYPDGTPKWPYQAGFQSFSTPAIGSDGALYFGSGDSNVYAVNANKTQKWKYPVGDTAAASPVIGPDGTVYIGCYDHKLYAFTPDGSLKWPGSGSFETSAEAMSPALGPDGTVYVGDASGKVYAVRPDGSSKWVYQTGGPVYSSPAVASDGTIYVGSGDHKLYAFRPDGSVKWDYPTGGVVYSSPAIGWAGTVYAGCWDGKLYAVSPTGEREWEFPTGGAIYSSPAVDGNGTIYVGSDDHKLYAIRASGSEKWSALLDAAVESPPAIGADGTVYVGCSSGKLYSIAP